MKSATCVEDLRTAARRRVPKVIFDYVEGGAYDEVTLQENLRAFAQIRFKQRVMIDVSERDLSTSVLGQRLALPLILAPTGLAGLVHGSGEILAARAAQRAGIPFCLSTVSICSIEQLKAASLPFWFQLYVMRDRGFTRSLVERADQAGCAVLVLTVDIPVLGQRHRDIKNGLSIPLKLKLANMIDVATKPAWAASVMAAPSRSFGNLKGQVPGADGVNSLSAWIDRQRDASVTWKDVDWIRAMWRGKLVVKGVLSREDAVHAADAGVDAVVVSNHGGRQLDGAPAAIEVLPIVADAVGDRLEVLFDSGVRSGHDLLKARALGARACLIGRAFLYGLGAGGERGVAAVIELMRKELDSALGLVGKRSLDAVDADVLWRGGLSHLQRHASPVLDRAARQPSNAAGNP